MLYIYIYIICKAELSSVSFMGHDAKQYCFLQYLYNIIKRQVFKPFLKYFFLKKFYDVISIINFKNTLFKGFTRGGPWAPSLMKQNLNRTKKYKVIAFKKNKKDF
jgi:hypothetical protein